MTFNEALHAECEACGMPAGIHRMGNTHLRCHVYTHDAWANIRPEAYKYRGVASGADVVDWLWRRTFWCPANELRKAWFRSESVHRVISDGLRRYEEIT